MGAEEHVVVAMEGAATGEVGTSVAGEASFTLVASTTWLRMPHLT